MSYATETIGSPGAGGVTTGLVPVAGDLAPHLDGDARFGIAQGPGFAAQAPIVAYEWPRLDASHSVGPIGDKMGPSTVNRGHVPDLLGMFTRKSVQEARSWLKGALTGSPTDPVTDPEGRGAPIIPARQSGNIGVEGTAGRPDTSNAIDTLPVTPGIAADIAGDLRQSPDTFQHAALLAFRASAPWVPVAPIPYCKTLVLQMPNSQQPQAREVAVPSGATAVRITWSSPGDTDILVSFDGNAANPSTVNAVSGAADNSQINDGMLLNPSPTMYYFILGKTSISVIASSFAQNPQAAILVNFQFFMQAG